MMKILKKKKMEKKLNNNFQKISIIIEKIIFPLIIYIIN